MKEDSKGIQSLEFAFEILDHIKQSNDSISVTELAKGMNVSKSKLHRYLVSFVRLGVLIQNKSTYLYSMGPKLVELGLSALNKFDVTSVSEPYIIELAKKINQSFALAIWTDKGPMVVKYYKSKQPINVEVQVGFYTPLLKSAAGKCFASFLPKEQTHELMEKELKEHQLDREEIEEEFKAIRQSKLSYRDIPYSSIPGSKAVASPIFNYSGEIVATLILIAFSEVDELNESSQEIMMLGETAANISKLL